MAVLSNTTDVMSVVDTVTGSPHFARSISVVTSLALLNLIGQPYRPRLAYLATASARIRSAEGQLFPAPDPNI